MSRPALLRKLATYIVVLALLNLLGTIFHWYETLWWFDMPMHFLGGVCVMYLCVVSAWPLLRKGMPVAPYIRRCVLAGIALGLLWELFEYILYRYSGGPVFIPLDSLSDVFFDCAGICAAAFAIVPFISQPAGLGTPL